MDKKVKSLIIVSTENDQYLAPYCVKSFVENMVGIDEIILICDKDSEELISFATSMGVRVDHDYGRRYIDRNFLHQSNTIINSDRFTTGDYIAVTSSNFILCRKYDIDNLIEDNKACILKDSYKSFLKYNGEIFKSVQLWKKSTEKVLGLDNIKYEYARGLPIIYPRELFGRVRNHILSISGEDNLVDYFNNLWNHDVPEKFLFSEYNVLGAFLEHLMPNSAKFIEMSTADLLYKYVVPTVGIFRMPINNEEAIESLDKKSNEQELGLLARKFLKKLSKSLT